MQAKRYPIIQMEECTVPGVHFARPDSNELYQEAYFTWQPMGPCGDYHTMQIGGGYLVAYRHVPEYREIEYHEDTEIFYFTSGDVVMPFCTIRDGVPDMQTLQIVYIPEKTQLILEPGTGHFVPVAANGLTAQIVVVAPKMDAPRLSLPTPVVGR